ncbi:putative spermidine/putrescine transport system substrate-binding protein [Rhodopseudomonas julia]|uniref:Spermidine/putrescine transport system substrate-binding protein n=1 Tax=Rhodopseudomonas julia TaxID=200617 RepID=A0ABU0C0V3_9BRAD|nr:ABC transporter substrate-binding protein [Rhodopseudomonas julia]MDQ0324153.1 putative spermidine/putrescine transport system substrate-binding protein [Rhodopseudomonas julia]
MRSRSKLVAALSVVLMAGSSMAAAEQVTVTSWGGAYQDAQREVYFKPFEEQTGIDLVEESWDGGIGVLRAQVEGGNATWDVVQVESEELQLGCDEGLFEELDWDQIGGKDRYIEAAVSPCGVGAIVYNFVLGYDKDKISEAPSGWEDFFDLDKYPGKRALRNGPKTNLEIALMADGVPPSEVYDVLATDEGVERAFKKLDTIKSDLVFWEAGAQPPQLLASGEVALTSIYNGRVDAANKADGRNFGIVWNESLYTLDSWVILAGSKNLDAAYKYLDFVGEAENQAKLPMKIAYGVTNPDASAMIAPERLKELPTADENMKNALKISDTFWLDNIDRLTERWSRWASTN